MDFAPFTDTTPGQHKGRVDTCPRNAETAARAERAMLTVRAIKLQRLLQMWGKYETALPIAQPDKVGSAICHEARLSSHQP